MTSAAPGDANSHPKLATETTQVCLYHSNIAFLQIKYLFNDQFLVGAFVERAQYCSDFFKTDELTHLQISISS